jgi:predicted nucleic acid-binding protein
MNVLLDTNILTRSAEPGHQMYQPATDAVEALRLQGHTLCIVPQVLYEFWAVATRPTAANGLGKTVPEAAAELSKLRARLTLLEDTPAILPEWERLVTSYAVLGKNAHDARLVAAMLVHGVTHLLTFNDQDFRRFAAITVLTPAAVLSPPPPPPPPNS